MSKAPYADKIDEVPALRRVATVTISSWPGGGVVLTVERVSDAAFGCGSFYGVTGLSGSGRALDPLYDIQGQDHAD